MKTEIDLIEGCLRKKLNYYNLRVEQEKISADEYHEKIRPITYRMKWLQVIKKIDGLYITLDNLRKNAVNFYNMGTADEFLIGKVNKGFKTKLDYEEVYNEVKKLYRSALRDFKKSIEDINEPDQLDDLITDL